MKFSNWLLGCVAYNLIFVGYGLGCLMSDRSYWGVHVGVIAVNFGCAWLNWSLYVKTQKVTA